MAGLRAAVWAGAEWLMVVGRYGPAVAVGVAAAAPGGRGDEWAVVGRVIGDFVDLGEVPPQDSPRSDLRGPGGVPAAASVDGVHGVDQLLGGPAVGESGGGEPSQLAGDPAGWAASEEHLAFGEAFCEVPGRVSWPGLPSLARCGA